MAVLFFVYSHRDEQYRDELEKHLTMLKRQGLVETWHDRRIVAGQHLDHTIDQHLETADVILLLVSADFLASDYCYDVEVRRAMERHERGEAIVIPVILRPCDWKSAPFGRLLALPRDGKPAATWSNPDEAFLDITTGIKVALAQQQSRAPQASGLLETPSASAREARTVRLGNARIPRDYSELEKDDFLEQAFNNVATFFEASLQQLEKENPGVQERFRRLDAVRFTAVAYRAGRPVSRCTIWMGGRSTFVGGIGYVENDSGATNSFNESLSVEADEYTLYLKPLGMAFGGRGTMPEKLTVEAAADYLWDLFLRRLRERA